MVGVFTFGFPFQFAPTPPQSCCAQGYRSRLHRDPPEDKGASAPFLPRQEVQAIGPEAQEDPRHPQGSDHSGCQPQDPEGAPQEVRLPGAQVRDQGLSARSFCCVFLD